MKRVYVWLCSAVILLSLASAAASFLRDIPAPVSMKVGANAGTPASSTSDEPLASFPVGRTVSVDFAPGESTLHQLTGYSETNERPIVDQYLDWLLYVVVGAAKDSAKDIAEILYDLPVVRHGYTRPTGSPEFGRVRSRDLGGGVVLALVSADRSEAQRKDDLAHIADDQRKSMGTLFRKMVVLEYVLSLDKGEAKLTRQPDLSAEELFSEAYGYREAAVSSKQELEQFLGTVQDLTRARLVNGRLLLGGRTLLSRTYRSITVEHVATLWQSEHKIQQAKDKLNDELETVKRDLERQLNLRLISREAAQREFDSTSERKWRAARLVPATGFSLDPNYDFDGLIDDYGRIRTLKDSFGRLDKLGSASAGELAFNLALLEIQRKLSNEEMEKVSQELANRNIVPLLKQIEHRLENSNLAKALLQEIERRNRFQVARYDGDIQGTEVGMILFYTDLLAKIWTIDYHSTAPREHIPGFVTDTRVKLSPVYARESAELPSARLWFGKSDAGFQTGMGGRELLFARKATRIYSAGSNPLRPGEEVQTSAAMSASTDWWNDHYEEVAEYEPEYERLNEVMKWSILLSWLNDQASTRQLDYLEDVRVQRGYRLPEWAVQHPELRFRNWKDINFFPEGYKGTKTEAMEILSSPAFSTGWWKGVISGGVTLAEKGLFRARQTTPQTMGPLGRSNIDYAASTGNRLVTFDKTTFVRPAGTAQRAIASAQLRPGAKLRGSVSQLANQKLETAVVRDADQLRVAASLGDAPIGELRIAPKPNGFTVGWRARELDAANALANDVSRAPDLGRAIAEHPRVTAVVELPEGSGYAVHLGGNRDWIVLARETKPSADIEPGWLSRSAHPDAERGILAKVVDGAALRDMIAGKDTHLVLDTAADRPFLRVASGAPSNAGRPTDFEIGGTKISGWAEPGGKAVRLDVQVLSEIRSGDLSALLKFREAAQKAAADPAGHVRWFDRRLADEVRAVDRLAAAGRRQEARVRLDDLVSEFGAQPDLLLRRALLRIEHGQHQFALNGLAGPPRQLRDRTSFFDEVNARLKQAGDKGRQDMSDLARYAEWSDRRSRDLGEAGRPMLKADGAALELSYRLDAAPHPIASPKDIGRSADAVYIADSPSLGNLDWQLGWARSLNTVMMNDLGQVIRLPRGDIAHFRPTTIVLPDGRVVKLQGKLGRIPNQVYRPKDDSGDCSDRGQNCDTDGGVYIVVPKAA